jgi:molecular chaperone DnaK (HSP70)
VGAKSRLLTELSSGLLVAIVLGSFDAMKLGIDFGTTRTVVAAVDRGNFPVVGFSGPDGQSLDWYPSVVAEKRGELCFGLDAVEKVSDPEWTVLRSFKRFLSGPDASPDTVIEIGSTQMPMIDLITRFLEQLEQDLRTRSNAPRPKEKELDVVVATPANSHSAQRFVTLESFRRAGFEVHAMLNEPSAAGVEYAHRYRNTITSKREHIVVYDLGGGTFDASLVRMSGRAHDVVASSGLARLGGDDFDEVLLDLTLEARGSTKDSLPARTLALLRDQCREAKERLHPNSKRVTIEHEGVANVSIDDYYARCAPLVERTLATLRRVLEGRGEDVIQNREDHSMERALDESEIAGIYVVGGASSLPIIARMLKDEFGRRVHRSAYPSAATAIGLAIALDDRAGFELTERFSHHFGVFREAQGGREVAFDPIFVEGAPQPSRAGGEHVEVRQYRAAHNIGHFRYIECGWLDGQGAPSGDITPYAEVLFPFDPELRRPGLDLKSVPIQRTGEEGPLVEERYAVQTGGVIEVTITDLETGFERRHRIS